MLKKASNFVLGSTKSSTYPRGYASGFVLPAALLDDLFEHPPHSEKGLNVEIFFDADIPLTRIAKDRHDVLIGTYLGRHFLGGKDICAGGDPDEQAFFLGQQFRRLIGLVVRHGDHAVKNRPV